MTKADLAVLEKAFCCEMEGRAFQSRSKRVQKLADEGYLIFRRNEDRSQRFAMTWEEYQLTHKGRIAYCETC